MQNYPTRYLRTSLFAALAMTGVMTAACSDTGDKDDIPLSEVPVNVINIVQNTLPGIALSEAEKETYQDKTIYELEGKLINGLKYEIEIVSDGTILKIELDD